LEEGIKYGGKSISDLCHAVGKNGEKQMHLNIYKQPGCKGCGRDPERVG
ncbi:DNA-formamidopyrimidine glycosylase, partial [Staphylococcus aureus]